jgi:glycosyltransferase involved in cell wall biosynthesis
VKIGHLSPVAPSDRPEISIVIPCFNEEGSVSTLIQRLEHALTPSGKLFEVLLINDGSRDSTATILATHSARLPWLKVINLIRNYGQTAAMMAGFQHATGKVIVAMDGDLQNDPADITKVVAKLDEGYDLVSGWRRDRKDHAIKRNLLSRFANLLISVTTGVRLNDYGCSLKAYRREVLEGISLYGEMHRFIPVYAHWNGARIAEVPVLHHPRTSGASKYGMERIVKVILDLFVVLFLQRYAQKPIYVFGVCGLVSFALSGLSGLAAVYYKFFGEKSFIQTPLPLLCATMFFTGVLCLLLGLVAEMANRIYYESQGKTTYIIASKRNLPAVGA